MNANERVAIATALQKGVKAATDYAREQIAADMSPGDRKALYIGNTKVGTASLTEGKKTASIRISNTLDFLNWCLDNQIMPSVSIPAVWYGRNGFCRIENGNLVSTYNGEVIPGVEVFDDDGEPTLQVRAYCPDGVDRDNWPAWVLGMCYADEMLEAISIPQMLEEAE